MEGMEEQRYSRFGGSVVRLERLKVRRNGQKNRYTRGQGERMKGQNYTRSDGRDGRLKGIKLGGSSERSE